jgi:hypothetical protein
VLYLRTPGGPSAVELTDFIPGVSTLASVPEPPSLALGGIGLLSGAGYLWVIARRARHDHHRRRVMAERRQPTKNLGRWNPPNMTVPRTRGPVKGPASYHGFAGRG